MAEWVSVGAMPVAGFRVLRPVRAVISRRNGDWRACSPWLNVAGYGRCKSKAMTDLMRGIADDYGFFEEHESRLGPDLLRLFGRVKRFVGRRGCN